jgi:hypothetical protein
MSSSVSYVVVKIVQRALFFSKFTLFPENIYFHLVFPDYFFKTDFIPVHEAYRIRFGTFSIIRVSMASLIVE